jgi:hypothetical protein
MSDKKYRMIKELQEGNVRNINVEGVFFSFYSNGAEEGRDQDSRDGMHINQFEEEYSCHASSIINIKLGLFIWSNQILQYQFENAKILRMTA